MNKILHLLTLTVGMLAALTFSARTQNIPSDALSPEELALFKEGAVMETYNPDKPSGHEITYIQPLGANHKPKLSPISSKPASSYRIKTSHFYGY